MDHIVTIRVPRRLMGKRKQGFMFDIQCWVDLSAYTQLAPSEWTFMAEAKGGDEFLIKAIYCGAMSYNKFYKKKINFNENDVRRWIDNTYRKDIGLVIEAMTKSRIGGTSLEELINEEPDKEKKK